MRMAKLTPELIASKRARAAELKGKGDSSRAADILRKLDEQGLSDPHFYREYADVRLKAGEVSGALETLAKMSRIYPRRPEVAKTFSDTLCQLRRYDDALRLLREFPRAEDPAGLVRLAAADILERQGKKEEAREYVAEVLSESPECEPAKKTWAMLVGNPSERIAALEDFLRSEPKSRELKLDCGYALSAAYDATKDYAGARRALSRTKVTIESDYAAELPALREQHERFLREMDAVARSLDVKKLGEWKAQTAQLPPLRTAILAGHPRSGTTLLESILDAHPEITSLDETGCFEFAFSPHKRNDLLKSPGALATALHKLDVSELKRAREHYRNLLTGFPSRFPDGGLALDKNPGLTSMLGLVRRLVPESKLLVALRDPRDVCVSCLRLPVSPNAVNVAWLRPEDTVRSYSMTMGIWIRLREILPAEDSMEVRYESLVENTRGVAAAAMEFLGVPWDESTMDYHREDRRRTIASPTYAQAAKPVYRDALRRWENYLPFTGDALDALEEPLRQLGYR